MFNVLKVALIAACMVTTSSVMASDADSIEKNRKKIEQMLAEGERYQADVFSKMSTYDKAIYNAYNGRTKSYSATYEISDEDFNKLTDSQKRSIQNTQKQMADMDRELEQLVIPKY